MKHELENELKRTLALADLAGKEIREYVGRGFSVRLKEDKSPVTEIDERINKFIIDNLRRHFPEDAIVSEEADSLGNRNGRRVWYVDPIDGTKSLVKGVNEYAVHIGLAIAGDPVLGVVSNPNGATYYGSRGGGAWKVEGDSIQQLSVMPSPSDLTAILSHNDNPAAPLYKRIGVQNMLRSGSEGLRVMHIVENKAHLRISSNRIKTWDVCAPDAILRSAGGIVTTESGKAVVYVGQRKFGEQIVYAVDKTAWEQSIAALKEAN